MPWANTPTSNINTTPSKSSSDLDGFDFNFVDTSSNNNIQNNTNTQNLQSINSNLNQVFSESPSKIAPNKSVRTEDPLDKILDTTFMGVIFFCLFYSLSLNKIIKDLIKTTEWE